MMPQDMPAPAERDVDKALLSLLTRGGHNTRYYACIFYHKKRRITTPFAEKPLCINTKNSLSLVCKITKILSFSRSFSFDTQQNRRWGAAAVF